MQARQLTQNSLKVLRIIASHDGITFGTDKRRTGERTGLLKESGLSPRGLSICIKALNQRSLVRRDADRKYRADAKVTRAALRLGELRNSLFDLSAFPVPFSYLFLDTAASGSESAFSPLTHGFAEPKDDISEDDVERSAEFGGRTSRVISQFVEMWESHILSTVPSSELKTFNKYRDALADYLFESLGQGERFRASQIREAKSRLAPERRERFEALMAEGRVKTQPFTKRLGHALAQDLESVERHIELVRIRERRTNELSRKFRVKRTKRRGPVDQAKVKRLKRYLHKERNRAIYENVLKRITDIPKSVLLIPLGGFANHGETIERLNVLIRSKDSK